MTRHKGIPNAPMQEHNCQCKGSPNLIAAVCCSCGNPIAEGRAKLGYKTCIKCAETGVKRIKEVTVAATSLQWF